MTQSVIYKYVIMNKLGQLFSVSMFMLIPVPNADGTLGKNYELINVCLKHLYSSRSTTDLRDRFLFYKGKIVLGRK